MFPERDSATNDLIGSEVVRVDSLHQLVGRSHFVHLFVVDFLEDLPTVDLNAFYEFCDVFRCFTSVIENSSGQ
jgi:hypothetical protein